MPLLINYLDSDLSSRDRAVITDIINQGIKTDTGLLLDPNAVVAKTNGRIPRLVIENLLDQTILPSMQSLMPKPIRASEMFLEHSFRHTPRYLTSGWNRINDLLGGEGWRSGEISELCGNSGIGKTQICLTSTIKMLLQDDTSQAIWIETIDHGFSAQRASEAVKLLIHSQPESHDDGVALEIFVKSVLSRINIYSCQDVYDILNAIETIRSLQRDSLSIQTKVTLQLLVIDSLSSVLANLLRTGDGVGHATMMHLSRELRQLALDFDLVVLVTTLPIQLSFPEDKTPSILMTNSIRPGLGSSWRYATDLQLLFSRLDLANNNIDEDYSKSLPDNEVEVDMSIEVPVDEVTEINSDTRVVEILKSKQLAAGEWCIFQLKAF